MPSHNYFHYNMPFEVPADIYLKDDIYKLSIKR